MTKFTEFIPMAFFPKQKLNKVPQSLATQLIKEDDRLTLAIAFSKILLYY